MAIKYKWLTERLELLIQRNIQAGIHKLPTEQQLCTKYHVSRQTVRMAMAMLEEKGLIVRKQGSGSYITCLLYTSCYFNHLRFSFQPIANHIPMGFFIS